MSRLIRVEYSLPINAENKEKAMNSEIKCQYIKRTTDAGIFSVIKYSRIFTKSKLF